MTRWHRVETTAEVGRTATLIGGSATAGERSSLANRQVPADFEVVTEHGQTGGLAAKFAWVTVGRVAGALIQALTMVVLIRAISAERFGLFAAVYGAMALPQTVFDLGLSTFIIRGRAKNRGDGRVTSALKLSNRMSAIMAVLLAGAGLLLGELVSSEYLLLMPLALWAAAERNTDTWLGVTFADGAVHVNTINLIARRASVLLLFLGWILLLQLDPLLGFGVTSAAVSIASWAFARIYVGRRLPQASGADARTLVRASWPFWINSMGSQARNLDTALTNLLAGPMQAAFYGAASRLTNPLRLLSQSLASVLLPASAQQDARSLTVIVKLIAVAVGALAGMYILLIVVMPLGVPWILGVEYVDAVPTLQVTSLGLIFASAATLLVSPLQGVGLQGRVATISVISTATCLAGVAVGAWLSGALGASIGMAASFVVQAALLLICLLRFMRSERRC